MNLSLRPALASELQESESLSRLNMAAYRAARGISWDPERFRRSWDEFENLAVVRGTQCCGFIRLLPEGDALAIRDIQIAPEFQGQGIGSALLRSALELSDQWLNIRRLELTVYSSNEVAIALYERFGFEVEAELSDFAFQYGNYVSALCMARINTAAR